MITIADLKKIFKDAKSKNDKYVVIYVKMPNCEKEEIIINEKENFDSKLDYYIKAYNNDLTLKSCNDISIVGIARYKSLIDFANDHENNIN